MKKTFLLMGLIAVCQTTTALPNPADFMDAEPRDFVDSLVANVHNVPVCLFSLPFWAQVRYIGNTALGGLVGNVCGVAFVNIFSSRRDRDEVNTWNPTKWGKGATIGTVLGVFIAEHFSRHEEFPKYRINKIDKDLLVLVITHYKKSEKLLEEIKGHFAVSRFPLVDAYFKLQHLHTTISISFDIFKSLNDKNDNSLVLSQLIFALDNVKNALLIIKNDPAFLEEQKNHTLLLTQQGLDTNNKIQMGALIADIAHSK